MRQYLAFFIVLGTLVTAHAEVRSSKKNCTSGFDKPAFLLFKDGSVELHIGKKVEVLEFAGSVGTGLSGSLVRSLKKADLEVYHEVEIVMSEQVGEEYDDIVAIVLFRDRVFWPCD